MPQKSWITRNEKRAKLSSEGKLSKTKVRNRCFKCGRPRGYRRKFDLCRICLREKIMRGEVPGVVKASW